MPDDGKVFGSSLDGFLPRCVCFHHGNGNGTHIFRAVRFGGHFWALSMVRARKGAERWRRTNSAACTVVAGFCLVVG